MEDSEIKQMKRNLRNRFVESVTQLLQNQDVHENIPQREVERLMQLKPEILDSIAYPEYRNVVDDIIKYMMMDMQIKERKMPLMKKSLTLMLMAFFISIVIAVWIKVFLVIIFSRDRCRARGNYNKKHG